MENDIVPKIQFFLKCQNIETGEVATFRFADQDSLLRFTQNLATQQLSIIDSHIAFYDIELLFNHFNDKVKPIDSGDINTAQSVE